MTRIFTALSLAVALGLSTAAAFADGGYMESGTKAYEDPALPIDTSVRR